jgi:hypothetical protein
VIPLADTTTHSGNGVVTITYRRVPTHLSAAIAFNIFRTFTVSGKLDSFSAPAVGQPLIFRAGRTFLCVAHTSSRGIGSCVLSYARSVAIRQNAGRFAVSFPGSAGYCPPARTARRSSSRDRLIPPDTRDWLPPGSPGGSQSLWSFLARPGPC